MKRLQGKAFQDRRHALRLYNFDISTNGRIRVNLCWRGQRKPWYYHWLNEAETTRFVASDYYKNLLYKRTVK